MHGRRTPSILATKKKPADMGEVDEQMKPLQGLGFIHRPRVDVAAGRWRVCKQVDGTVPVVMRRETGGAVPGENLPVKPPGPRMRKAFLEQRSQGLDQKKRGEQVRGDVQGGGDGLVGGLRSTAWARASVAP